MNSAFWFGPQSPRPLAAMRIGLGLVLSWATMTRWPHAIESYSTAGLPLPLPGLGAMPRPSPFVTCALHGVLIGAVVGVAAGFRTRLSLLVAFGLLSWFALLDFPGTLRKDTVIGLHLLLLLSCTRSSAVWSVDAWSNGVRDRIALPPAWPRRLMQILVCSIYLGAAVTKLRMRDFATGDLLTFALLDDRWSTPWLGPWLSTRPQLVVLASFATVLFEFAFPLLIWVRPLRRVMLGSAVLFHLVLAAFLDLGTFTPTMWVALLAFVEERDLGWIRVRSAGRVRSAECGVRSGGRVAREVWGYGIWLCVIGMLGCGSTMLLRWSDGLGAFGRELPPPVVIAADEVEPLLVERWPPLTHYVHRVELGTRVSQFHTFGRNDRFVGGDVLHVLVRLNGEHPSLALETRLVDPTGAESQPVVQSLAAGETHALVRFRLLPSFASGRYRVLGTLEGEAVFECTFDFTGDE